MNTDEIFLTKEKITELQAELERLTTVDRNQIAHDLDEAKAMGDLKENAEYHQAREDQAILEARVQEIEHLLKHGQVIKKGKHDTVEMGATVTIAKKGSSAKKEYMVVSPAETDPSAGKLSTDSPIVAAMMGKTTDDFFVFTTPDGEEVEWKVVEVK